MLALPGNGVNGRAPVFCRLAADRPLTAFQYMLYTRVKSTGRSITSPHFTFYPLMSTLWGLALYGNGPGA